MSLEGTSNFPLGNRLFIKNFVNIMEVSIYDYGGINTTNNHRNHQNIKVRMHLQSTSYRKTIYGIPAI